MRAGTESVECPSWVGLIAIAVAAFFVVAGGATLYGGWGYLDPWIYTGLIHEYGDTLARFGRTYYSTRVAAIWPQGILYSLIGEPAYLLVRWLTLFGAGAGLALALRGLGSRWVGYFAGVALVFFSPLLSGIMDDYTQPIAIAYAMLSFAAIVQRQPAFAVASGVLAGAAIGAHEITIYLFAPLVVALTVAALPRLGIKDLSKRAGLFLAGAVSIQLVFSLFMGGLYGWTRSNVLFQETALNTAVALGKGLAANWAVSWNNNYGRIMTAVIVVLIWLLITTFALIRRDRVVPARILGATTAMGVLMVMVLITHFVFEASYVGTGHTIITAAVLTLSCAWLALSALEGDGHGPPIVAGVTLVLAITFGFLVADPAGDGRVLNLVWWGSVVAAIAAAISSLVFGKRLAEAVLRRQLAIGAMLLAGIITPLAPLTTTGQAKSYYAAVRSVGAPQESLGDHLRAAKELRQVTIEVQRIVVTRVPPEVPLRFWYPSGAGMEHFNSIQSAFLWLSSCVLCDQVHPFPQIPAEQAAALRAGDTQVLVILAPSRSVAAEASALAGSGMLPFTQRDAPIRVSSGGLTVWVAINARPGAIPPQ
ncbi:MAG: hypothetical protein ABGY24_12525 [bacterium]